MSILSLQFLLFLLGATALYFVVPKKWQWIILFIANILFYLSFGVKYIGYILFTAIITYWAAIKLETVGQEGKEAVAAAAPADKKSIREKFLKQKKRTSGSYH